jgi:hypothetical protein
MGQFTRRCRVDVTGELLDDVEDVEEHAPPGVAQFAQFSFAVRLETQATASSVRRRMTDAE